MSAQPLSQTDRASHCPPKALTGARLLAALLMFIVCSAGAEEPNHDISGLLRKMAEADDVLNYQGVFILLKADELMTMRVEHGVDERGVWESIEALNGEHRRIVRNNDEVVSVYPERKLITISHAHSKSSLHPSLPENIDKLSQYYRIKQLENDHRQPRNRRHRCAAQ
jgi:sigma-E factor negative regulatory protein RseB